MYDKYERPYSNRIWAVYETEEFHRNSSLLYNNPQLIFLSPIICFIHSALSFDILRYIGINRLCFESTLLENQFFS
ncbi:hypothetical protein J45TS6_19280 [Paenibacillus sp. J45TS6]|nr:hypothetical protein J45TS6_19280 [Paenibacillus sp. J45TS6]